MPLDFSHDPFLVVASFAIAVMAGFTGLSMTQGASQLAPAPRKVRVAASAVILGGGIWSMHFVAMLGLQLPVPFFYDSLITLISALIAILLVGLGLLVLHFRDRTARTITLSGLTFGIGILAMHYVGMAGMEACKAVYTPLSVAMSVTVSLGLSVLAVWIAYGQRARRNILVGTVCFAVAVVALHFLAVSGTTFIKVPLPELPELGLSNEGLAFVVTLASFAICGGALLAGATFWPQSEGPPEQALSEQSLINRDFAAPDASATVPIDQPEIRSSSRAPVSGPSVAGPEPHVVPEAEPNYADPLPSPPGLEPNAQAHAGVPRTVPYEQNGRTLFADLAEVAAFRAEGHYTIIYHGNERGFCPWSISEAEKRLKGSAFLRAHRSYLINPDHVSGFERKKDSGVAFFDSVPALEKAPVSRSRLADVRQALGL